MMVNGASALGAVRTSDLGPGLGFGLGRRNLADGNATIVSATPAEICPWVGSDSGSEFFLQCMDGTLCQAKPTSESSNPGDWSCCSSTARGGRAKCLKGTTMCARVQDCAGG